MKSRIVTSLVCAALLMATSAAVAQAAATAAGCTKFVSEAGGGRQATLERPAKDMGNIVDDLVAGDVICIAGGTYTGRADSGADLITVPVSIYGGFSPDFEGRDPWGAHMTVMTGVHNSANFVTNTRLTIDTSDFATKLMAARGQDTVHTVLVDGLVFDNGPRNYYADGGTARIIRMGTPANKPTPESGALTIRTGITSSIVVRHVVALNTAPTQGVIAFFPGAGALVTIENNVAVNNTGAGFHLGTAIAASDPNDYPSYTFRNNISVFNEKHDAFGTFGGSGVILESGTKVEITNSILAFNDNFGIDNAKRADRIVVNDNMIAFNANADYLEFDTKIGLADIEDWSRHVYDGFGNVGSAPAFGVSEAWGSLYGARNIIDRNAAEADVQVVESWANDVRAMFPWMNLMGTDLDVDSAVWLPRMSIADALAVAVLVDGQYGVYWP